MRYDNIVLATLKLYVWSIHIANNLTLAISFCFKLNSDFARCMSKIPNLGHRKKGDFHSRNTWTPCAFPSDTQANDCTQWHNRILLATVSTKATGVKIRWRLGGWERETSSIGHLFHCFLRKRLGKKKRRLYPKNGDSSGLESLRCWYCTKWLRGRTFRPSNAHDLTVRLTVSGLIWSHGLTVWPLNLTVIPFDRLFS